MSGLDLEMHTVQGQTFPFRWGCQIAQILLLQLNSTRHSNTFCSHFYRRASPSYWEDWKMYSLTPQGRTKPSHRVHISTWKGLQKDEIKRTESSNRIESQNVFRSVTGVRERNTTKNGSFPMAIVRYHNKGTQ